MKTLFALTIVSLLAISCKKDNPEPEPTPPAPVTSIGAVYQGGIVFQLDADGQHGLIITEQDIDTCKWTNEVGNASDFVETIPQSFKDQYSANNYVGAGLPFTNKIVEVRGASGVYAAKVCQDLTLNGYSDWFLPSHGEMFLALNSELFNSSNATQQRYWTSTEGSTNFGGSNPMAQSVALYSWASLPSTGANKNTLLPVRAIRKF